jgi:IS5 family transposase
MMQGGGDGGKSGRSAEFESKERETKDGSLDWTKREIPRKRKAKSKGVTAPQFWIGAEQKSAASADSGADQRTTWVRNKVVEPMLIYRDPRSELGLDSGPQ